ncbi:hypothetical protein EZV62_020562 [Acer yangbiense]|uniref:(+)-delta-cadinene synthase n=1 Tax=Acer yangbiense TaxID=1000413 RepID=A0A5C7HGH1_9ROSI|nr:hypothetical protein EZV62_020562 [Acer yangbiense]
MINNEDAEMLTILDLLDDIQRLGLRHRFDKDIKRALDDRIVSWDNGHEYDIKAEEKLNVTALKFRLLRQHGYRISQDVFKAFMDDEKKFKKYVESDVKGMLSLYEASFLAFEGENIMDEALTFCRTHLNEVKSMANPALSELVSHGLEIPLHRRMVQSDLKDMSRWWTEIDLARKLNFARDRLMECFFWTVGMIPNPQFNQCRQELTKVAAFITAIDDIYDVYATLDELECFTNAVQRWDLKAVDDLPDYMKLCFMALYNSWGDLCKAFLQEAKWCYNKYMPTFEEYLENGWRSVSGTFLLVHAYFSVSQSITKEALESLYKQHNLMRYSSIIFRLCNDLATSTAELERGETASSILCYMYETGVSEEVAREHIRTLIDETWMKMNKDVVVDDGHPFAEPFVETAINLARIAHCTYQYGDGHGAPDGRAKQNVFSLLIEPISLMKSQQQ